MAAGNFGPGFISELDQKGIRYIQKTDLVPDAIQRVIQQIRKIKTVYGSSSTERGETLSDNQYLTVTEALQDLKKRGFTSNFEFIDGMICDVDSRQVYSADVLTIVEHHRFEGMSNPDDMSIVYAIVADDDSRGILVDAFGPYSNPDLGDFLEKVIGQVGSRLQY